MGKPLIFLYTEAANIAEVDLAALRDAGFIPIRVASFEDVKVVDPLVAGDRSVILNAAVKAIHMHGMKEYANDGPKTLFAKFMTAAFLDSPPNAELK